ncbi:MAG TPA: TetR/AcrR family transcriptional regulator [Longimicrobiales bacterium]|nr:TetR/AcrR family transcriptional regulator [Longimicrobiales bacterium]
MGTIERREREKEHLREKIVEAARDILSERGLEGFSMREIARRIEYSPATIYLYFQSKEDLVRAVVREGMRRLSDVIRIEMEAAGEHVSSAERYRASGRGYVRFALENTAYFHVIFDLPGEAQMEGDCSALMEGEALDQAAFERVVGVLGQACREGTYRKDLDVEQAAVIGWATLHGLVSLFLSGHLQDFAPTREQFEVLVERSLDMIGLAWRTPIETR